MKMFNFTYKEINLYEKCELHCIQKDSIKEHA